jgi:hypothetical protein
MDIRFGVARQPARVSPVNIGLRKHPLEPGRAPNPGPAAQELTKYGQRKVDFVRSKSFEQARDNPYVACLQSPMLGAM